LLVLLPRVSHC